MEGWDEQFTISWLGDCGVRYNQDLVQVFPVFLHQYGLNWCYTLYTMIRQSQFIMSRGLFWSISLLAQTTKLLNLYISIIYSLTQLSIRCIFVYISSCTLFCFNQLPLLALLANYSNCLPFNSDYALTQQVESDPLLEKKYERKWGWNYTLRKIQVWTN